MSETDNQSNSLHNDGSLPAVVRTHAELAARLGVSSPSVTRALKRGRIQMLPGGGFDVAACAVAWRENTARGGRPSAARGNLRPETGSRGAEQVEVPEDATAAVVETLAAHGTPLAGQPTLRDAETAGMILKARKLQLDCDRLVGKLVEREKAHDVLATFERVSRDAWLAWPTAIAPAIASELGIADLMLVENVLTAHIRAHLEVLAKVPPPDDLLPVAT